MKSAKISILALMSVLLAGSLVAAPQNAERKGPRGAAAVQERVDAMDKELKLTDAQKTKITALLKEEGEKAREWRQKNESATREQRQEHAKTVLADHQKKMKEILTADQYEKWQKWTEQQRANRRGGKAGGPSGEKKAQEKTQ